MAQDTAGRENISIVNITDIQSGLATSAQVTAATSPLATSAALSATIARVADAGNAFSGDLMSGTFALTDNGTGKLTDGYSRVDITIAATKACTLNLQECDDNATWVTTESWAIPDSTTTTTFPFPLHKKYWRRQLVGGTESTACTLTAWLDPRTIDHETPILQVGPITVANTQSEYTTIPVGSRSVYAGSVLAGSRNVAGNSLRVTIDDATHAFFGPCPCSNGEQYGHVGKVPIPKLLSDGASVPAVMQAYNASDAAGILVWYDFYP